MSVNDVEYQFKKGDYVKYKNIIKKVMPKTPNVNDIFKIVFGSEKNGVVFYRVLSVNTNERLYVLEKNIKKATPKEIKNVI